MDSDSDAGIHPSPGAIVLLGRSAAFLTAFIIIHVFLDVVVGRAIAARWKLAMTDRVSFTSPDPYMGPGGALATYTPDMDYLFPSYFGYTIYDLLTMFWQPETHWSMWLHHLMGAYGAVGMMFFRRMSIFPCYFMITEITAVANNLLWYAQLFSKPKPEMIPPPPPPSPFSPSGPSSAEHSSGEGGSSSTIVNGESADGSRVRLRKQPLQQHQHQHQKLVDNAHVDADQAALDQDDDEDDEDVAVEKEQKERSKGKSSATTSSKSKKVLKKKKNTIPPTNLLMLLQIFRTMAFIFLRVWCAPYSLYHASKVEGGLFVMLMKVWQLGGSRRWIGISGLPLWLGHHPVNHPSSISQTTVKLASLLATCALRIPARLSSSTFQSYLNYSTKAAKMPADIQVYLAGTPNGQKIPIALEELGIPYDIKYISFAKQEQFAPEFLKISPNNKIPAIVDLNPPSGGSPISVFESAVILRYLASVKSKPNDLYPSELRYQISTDEWLTFQVASVGPMMGQLGHFSRAAPEKIPYAIKRFTDEVTRLYNVMEKRLSEVEYFNGKSFSIADIAIVTWAKNYEFAGIDISKYPHVKAWLDRCLSRPAVQRGLEKSKAPEA
ncbi:Glutathione S-transferase 7 [Blyttiomyces sp. JEL0837]|nr:Glutathione S-transferase 7 [Blyttiomyces sp. JEL0837]